MAKKQCERKASQHELRLQLALSNSNTLTTSTATNSSCISDTSNVAESGCHEADSQLAIDQLSARASAACIPSMTPLDRVYVGLQQLAVTSDVNPAILSRLIADIACLEQEFNSRQCYPTDYHEGQSTGIACDLLKQTCCLLQRVLKQSQDNVRLVKELDELRHVQYLQSTDTSTLDGVSTSTQLPDTSECENVIWLRMYANELNAANCRWAAHCESLERDHATRLQLMQMRAKAAERCIAELSQSPGRHRSHDQRHAAVRDCFRQAESSREVATQDCSGAPKQTAAILVHEHDRADNLQASVAQLERQLAEAQAITHTPDVEQHMNITETFVSPTTSSENYVSHSSMAAMRVKIQVLQQQLSIFKEDFGHENAERRQAVREVDELRAQLAHITSKWHAAEQQMCSLKAQLATALSDKSSLERRFAKKVATLQKVQQDLLETPQNTTSLMPEPASCRDNAMFTGCRPHHFRVMSPPSAFERWHCAKCTYVNEPTRTVCEICNAKGPVTSNQMQGSRDLSYDELMARETRGIRDSSSANHYQGVTGLSVLENQSGVSVDPLLYTNSF